MTALPPALRRTLRSFDQPDRGALALLEHPRLTIGDVLQVRQFGAESWQRGSRRSDEGIKCIPLIMARLFGNPVVVRIAAALKAVELFDSGQMGCLGFSVKIDQVEGRVGGMPGIDPGVGCGDRTSNGAGSCNGWRGGECGKGAKRPAPGKVAGGHWRTSRMQALGLWNSASSGSARATHCRS
jgi:hypothetical protein